MNYDIGDLDTKAKIIISISVNEQGRLTMHIIDEASKNSRKQGVKMPN
ncbi:MAG: hypothetical protein GY834_09700 [Bacteroidetes bacterium]|nr:hypothetical protein [Bacteroidota bacterium]